MSSTAAPTSTPASSSTSQTAQAGRAGQPGARRAGDAGTENGLFANLLSLLADTHDQALPDLGADVAGDPGDGEALLASDDVPDDNPLAALAGWPGSPVPVEPDAATPGGSRTGPALEAVADAEPAMQAVDEPAPQIDLAADHAAHESPHGLANTAQRSQAALKGLSATALAQVQPPKGSSAASAGAAGTQPLDGSGMVWRRTDGSVANGLASSNAHALAGMRSTVTLNERFGNLAGHVPHPVAAREAAATGLATVQASGGGAGASGTATPSATIAGTDAGLAAAGASGTDAGGSDLSGDANDAQMDHRNPDGSEAFTETEGQQISHWGTQNLRHASLRVGDGGQDAIDIQLSVKGQEVQVDFRTDSADARANLAHSDESLAEMLQRSGIQLAGVSVGAQGQGGERKATPGDPGAARASRAPHRVDGTTVASETPRSTPLRADGSRPLDLFV